MGIGDIPVPDPGTDMIYVVFVPTAAYEWANNRGGSYHGYANANVGGTTTRYQYAAMQAASSLSFLMAVVGHELAETVSNPAGSGVTVHVSAGCDCEIVDVCCTSLVTVGGGYQVPRYYVGGACEAPVAWKTLSRYERSTNTWPVAISATAGQVAQGRYGLAYTDQSGNIFLSRNNAVSKIASVGVAGSPAPPSMIAVDSTTVYAIDLNEANLYKYNGSGTGWTSVGTDVSGVYAGAYGVFATLAPRSDTPGMSGALFKYTGSSWQLFGSPSLAFAVGDSGLYQLGVNRALSYYNGSSWSSVSGSVGDLYAGPTGTAGTSLFGRLPFYAAVGGSPIWQGSAANAFATTLTDGASPAQLYKLPSRGVVQRSTNLAAGNPTWESISPSFQSRIFGGGPNLYGAYTTVQK
jgi:hypothetical protein